MFLVQANFVRPRFLVVNKKIWFSNGTPVTKSSLAVVQFKSGDLTSQSAFKTGSIYPSVVLPNEIATSHHLTTLFSSSGRLNYSSGTFLRFCGRGFAVDPGVMESQDRLKEHMKKFWYKVSSLIRAHEAEIRASCRAVLQEKQFCHEEEVVRQVFETATMEARFAVHKVLFEELWEWVKDSQWTLTEDHGAGPYILRPKAQVGLMEAVERLFLAKEGFLKGFQAKIRQKLENDSVQLQFSADDLTVFALLKTFADEFYLNVITAESPLRRLLSRAFLGVAFVDSQVEARSLLQKLSLTDFNYVAPDVQPISRPLKNSFLNSRRAPIVDVIVNATVVDREEFGNDLAVWAIDPPGTVEVDDGITIEQTNNSTEVKLHVHVADPTSFFSPDSAISQIAQRRAESLYLTERRIPMLPVQLTELATLKSSPSVSKPAITFSCTVDLQSGQISQHEIRRTMLKNVKNVTYSEAESLLDGSRDLKLLQAVAKAHLSYRKQNGHFSFAFPRGVASFDEKGVLKVDREESIEGSMKDSVAEAMIIAGRVAGELLREGGIPAPYRFHPGLTDVDVPSSFSSESLSLLETYRILRTIPQAAVDHQPRPHKIMGLEAYVKVTSPLRRYLDLVCHFNLFPKVSRVSSFDSTWFQQNLPEVYCQERYNRRLSSAVNRFWIEKFMRLQPASPWTLHLLDRYEDGGVWTVHVDEVATNFTCKLVGRRKLDLGERCVARLVPFTESSTLHFAIAE